MGQHSEHHFVPQFYLRNFAIDATSDEPRRIALFNIPSGRYVPCASIRDQARKTKLYGMDGGEQALGSLETAVAPIIRRMARRNEVPTYYSRSHEGLIVFLLVQSFRTPTAGSEYEEHFKQISKVISEQEARFRPNPNEYEFHLDEPVRRMLKAQVAMWPIVMDLRYKLLLNDTACPYVTSDHPVVFYNQFMEHRRHFGSGTGLGSEGLQIFYPISPRCTLMMFDAGVYRVGGRSKTSILLKANEKDVEGLNTLQAVNAGSQIFMNAKFAESSARRIVANAERFRGNPRTVARAFPPTVGAHGNDEVYIHYSRSDPKTGLRLSMVDELPSVSDFKLGDRVTHFRDPRLMAVCHAFDKAVSEKKYRPSQFRQFVQDLRWKAGAG